MPDPSCGEHPHYLKRKHHDPPMVLEAWVCPVCGDQLPPMTTAEANRAEAEIEARAREMFAAPDRVPAVGEVEDLQADLDEDPGWEAEPA